MNRLTLSKAGAGVSLVLVIAGSTLFAGEPDVVYPAETWPSRTAEKAGLSRAKLDPLRDLVGGRGCVVRHGYMVYAWGDQARSHDVASAMKPLVMPSLDLIVSWNDSPINDHDQSPGNPGTRINQAARLIREAVVAQSSEGSSIGPSADATNQSDPKRERQPVAKDSPASHTRLAIQGTQFTLNDKPTFLYGISYYGALGASEEFIQRDLDDMQRHGFNWIRVWATWAAFTNNVAAVNADGSPRGPFLTKLKKLVTDCDRRGLVVDVTFSRGNGVAGAPRLQTHEAHRRAVETVVTALKPWRNWYLDLSNERNIKDQRFTSFDDLKSLRELARQLDPQRLVTASHAGDLRPDEVREYVRIVRVDFLSPHRPRHAGSAPETAAKTKAYLMEMEKLGRIVPVHYQEPFRRGFGRWEPRAADFVTDALAAQASGAAGWCFHNGDERGKPDGQPGRSFDLRGKRLFDQLDEVEKTAIAELARQKL